MVETSGSCAGKYSLLNTIPATTPYRKKSYHSTVAPMTLANATRRITLLSIAILSSPMDGRAATSACRPTQCPKTCLLRGTNCPARMLYGELCVSDAVRARFCFLIQLQTSTFNAPPGLLQEELSWNGRRRG